MFHAIEQGPCGDTVTVADSKREAYKQAAYVQNVLGRPYPLTRPPAGRGPAHPPLWESRSCLLGYFCGSCKTVPQRA